SRSARQSVSDRQAPAPLSYAESRFGELHFGWSPLRSVRDGTWKYIDAPMPELYDLSKDTGERDNRRETRHETAAALARALADITSASRTPAAPAARSDAAARLRSLGYISGRVALDKQAGRDAADPKVEIGRYVAYVDAFNDALARLESGRARDAETRFRALARSFPPGLE